MFRLDEELKVYQKDMFFNEAESLGAQTEPAAEETPAGDDGKIDVPGHQRAKRGRKPLDPALPREVVRHELPEGERVCPHDGAALGEIGVEATEQLDIIAQQVRVIRHELAWIATSKYLDGLPLYRQAALLGRLGGTDISRNTVTELTRRRQRDSTQVLLDIETLLLANVHAVLPKSLLGQALHYLASQWSKLKRYVEDGRATASTTTCRRTPSGRSASGGATGCSPIPWPAPTPARTCTRCCRPAGSTASTASGPCAPCSSRCPTPRPSMTTPTCCLGA